MQTKVLLEKVNAMCREPVAHRGLTLWDVTFEKEGPRYLLTVVVCVKLAPKEKPQKSLRLAERGVAVRAGIHCAPLAHRTAGTVDTGTVRLSVSNFNTPQEIFQVLDIFRGISP